jgi:hypothetical protein
VIDVVTLCAASVFASNGCPLASAAAASARCFSTAALNALARASASARGRMIAFASAYSYSTVEEMLALADERGEDMRMLRVVIVIWPVEIGWHDTDVICPILTVQIFTIF